LLGGRSPWTGHGNYINPILGVPMLHSGSTSVAGHSVGVQTHPESTTRHLELHLCLPGSPQGPYPERRGGCEHSPNLPGRMLSLTACSRSLVDCWPVASPWSAPVEASRALPSAVMVFWRRKRCYGCVSAWRGSFIVEEGKSSPGLVISQKNKPNQNKPLEKKSKNKLMILKLIEDYQW